MTDQSGKPRGKPLQETVNTTTEPGRLQTDDRVNDAWEWTDEGMLADDALGVDDTLRAAERMRALVNPKLDIVDDSDPLNPEPFAAPQTAKSGYNPYNSGQRAKDSWKKKKDLRELSKWIELRKKMAEKKEEE